MNKLRKPRQIATALPKQTRQKINLTKEEMAQVNLRTFLKQHKALSKFKHNFRNQKLATNKDAELYLKAEHSLSTAFIWRYTPEGDRFWKKLANKWKPVVGQSKEYELCEIN